MLEAASHFGVTVMSSKSLGMNDAKASGLGP